MGDDAVEYALEIRGLTKRFGGAIAVDDLTLAVPHGSFYGLVGPNGAGKTTTLAMATGLLRPDGGGALVHGIDVWQHPQRAKPLIGNLADGVDLYDQLTGEQLITFSGLLFGLDRATLRGRVADLLHLLDLEDAAGQIVADYSAGMTKKIALAAALIHSPRLLVLDEPFESVDPVSAANIRDILDGFVKGGGTVVVSSHSMDLVERMCDHVAIIAAGKALVSGTMGIRGLHDRLGRAMALVIIAMPATIVVQTAVALVIGRTGDLPALLGLSLGTFLSSVGVVSVSSARFVVPVARSGRSPFSAQAGSATTSIFASYAVAVVTIVLVLPVLGLTVAAMTAGIPALGWLALTAGLGLGSAVAWGGVALGGRVLDASGPAMLARLRAIRA